LRAAVGLNWNYRICLVSAKIRQSLE